MSRSRWARLRPTRRPRRQDRCSSASSACAARTVPTTSSSRSTTTAAPTTRSPAAADRATPSPPLTASRAASSPTAPSFPNRGHYLCVNSVGYSLGAYPAGNGTTATGDATYTTDIPTTPASRIFNTNVAGELHPRQPPGRGRLDERGEHALQGRHRLSGADAVLDRLRVLPRRLRQAGLDHDVRRRATSRHADGHQQQRGRLHLRRHQRHLSAGAGQRLGAPGPENLSSPIQRNASFAVRVARRVRSPRPPRPTASATSPAIPANNSTFGTLDSAGRFVNNTGGNVTRLRFRVIDHHDLPGAVGHRRPAAAHVGTVGGRGIVTPRPARPPVRRPRHLHRHRAGHDPRAAAQRSRTAAGFNGSVSAGTVTLAHAAGQRRVASTCAPARHSADRQLQVLSEHRSPAVTRR